MYKNEKERAITLIALIITIVLLLIIAGVSVSMITGTDRNNGASYNSKRRNQ